MSAVYMLNDEKLEAFPVISGTRQECFLPPLLFTVTLEGLANAVMQKRSKKYTVSEGRNKVISQCNSWSWLDPWLKGKAIKDILGQLEEFVYGLSIK